MPTSVPYQEKCGSPVVNTLNEDGEITGQRTLYTAWDDAAQLAADFIVSGETLGLIGLPTARAYNTTIRPYIPSRSKGVVDDSGTPDSSLVVGSCTGFELTCDDPNLTDIAYDFAEVRVFYRVPEFGGGNPGETQCLVKVEPQCEFLTLDNQSIGFTTTQVPYPETIGPGYLDCGALIRYDCTCVPKPLPTIYRTYNGCINDAPVNSPSLSMTFPTETLLYQLGSVCERPDGKLDVSFTFQYKPNGWNRFLDATTGTWDTLSQIEGGQPPSSHAPNGVAGTAGAAIEFYTPCDFSLLINA